jgi:hypothetical protein
MSKIKVHHHLAYVIRAVHIDTLPEIPEIPKVTVGQSDQQGRGVFLNAGERINVGDIVTKYSGSPRWATEDEVQAIRDPKYVFTWGHVHADGHVWHVLWDGIDFLNSWDAHSIGHFYNSTHPTFEPPWNDPTCAFGLYFGPSFCLNVTVTPDIELYMIAIKRVVAKHISVELSTDYHHILTELNGRLCGDLGCLNCYESMKRYMRRWKRQLSYKKRVRNEQK